MRRIVVLEATGSTNDDVRSLATGGAPEGTVVLAGRQWAGRGRLGRSWESPDGLGLYLSVLLRPQEPPEHQGRYAIAAAVAVCEACREFADDRIVLKWPNDVLADHRKLAGILAETRQGAQGTELVLGVGVNVGHQRADLPESLADAAVSLRILRHGVVVGRDEVASAVLRSIGDTVARLRSGRWREVSERFLRYAPDATGRRVRLRSGQEGITSGLDDSGALKVGTADGIVLAYASESVSPVEE